MKYKVGDKVKIASESVLLDHKDVAYTMLKFADKIVTINMYYGEKYYYIKEDNALCIWPEELLSFVSSSPNTYQEDISLEDKIKNLESDIGKINERISKYNQIVRQKSEIKIILDDIKENRSVEINDLTLSILNLPDCNDFIRNAITRALIDTCNELDRIEGLI